MRKYKKMPLWDLIDLSVNETLSRTIITAGTVFLAVLALYLFGTEAIHGFSFAMLFGVIIGTWSSIFVASPLLIFFGLKRDDDKSAPTIMPKPPRVPVAEGGTQHSSSGDATAMAAGNDADRTAKAPARDRGSPVSCRPRRHRRLWQWWLSLRRYEPSRSLLSCADGMHTWSAPADAAADDAPRPCHARKTRTCRSSCCSARAGSRCFRHPRCAKLS